jgi:Rod binding domain-containing protein
MTAASPTGQSNWYDFQSLASMQSQATVAPKAATKGVAQQFESLYINMMLTEMRKTVGHSELTGSSASDTYTEMFDQQVSVSMAKAGGIGLAPFIEKQLNRVAASRSNPANTQSGSSGSNMLIASPAPTALPVAPSAGNSGAASTGMAIPVMPTEYALKSRILNDGG